MTLSTSTHPTTEVPETAEPAPKPRFGGVLRRTSRLTRPAMLPLAGKRWNPIFAVVEHRGRKTGRGYRTPVAARRSGDGFTIALAFGAQVDWYRNLVAAGGIIFEASNERHGLRNTGTNRATYFVIKFVPHDLEK